MQKYIIEYLPTAPTHKKYYKATSRVDGLALKKELEALLLEYQEKGYKLFSTETLITTELETNKIKTDGILVILEKIE